MCLAVGGTLAPKPACVRYVRGVERFGRYRVTGTLGTGAMGEVHLAVDEVLGREVAVKTLKSGASGLAAHLLDERFRQEARAIASLAHPGVVQVFDIDVNADPPYLVMERVSGPSLKERLAEKPLSDREVRALGIQIANALAAAHAAGILHRDVKPANILCAGEGTWKLADFGVAHVPDSSITMTGQFVGSPAYAAPEALLRGQLGAAGDIYGLGATLYQAIAGRWPRSDANTGALFAPPPPLRELAPHVSPQVADIIDRAVATEPDARPTASDFASALARAATQPSAHQPTPVPVADSTEFVASTPAAPVVTLPGQPAPHKRDWRLYALTLAILVVIILIAISRRTPALPTSSPRAPEERPFFDPQPQTPQTIRAQQPPLPDKKAEKDWNKVVRKLQEQRFGDARRELSHFEERWGESPETRDLATQLESLPASYLGGEREDD
jgi:serine/threonine protein kinase